MVSHSWHSLTHNKEQTQPPFTREARRGERRRCPRAPRHGCPTLSDRCRGLPAQHSQHARAASKSATSHSLRAEVRHCVLVSVVSGEVGGELGSDFGARARARAFLAALSARWSATNRQNGCKYARMYARTDRLIVRAKRPRNKSFRLTNVACADTKREAMSASWLTPASQPAAPEPRAKTL